jgi:hypothetical protein
VGFQAGQGGTQQDLPHAQVGAAADVIVDCMLDTMQCCGDNRRPVAYGSM